MNVGEAATQLGLFGMKAVIKLNAGVLSASPQEKWLGYTVAAIVGGLGTFLSVIQCARERIPSYKTMATLVTNLATVLYSIDAVYFKPHYDLIRSCAEELQDSGTISNPDCPPPHELFGRSKDQFVMLP
ncbi:hypothetical protein [Endozoicomonas sp. SCSIO W0465]|uniref:hypothetical protein n=1 Tax=Endozoicomonas sp. SCSIO W0465 TaxID=2918516 RepID=UPI0020752AE3|nr:hypothetical protein [Endozoicomonas sp. SCSIO W0465]USE37799.1 hypothetical protein MJO57_06295 [Endozoicomonas sp. SCSIO W0465]